MPQAVPGYAIQATVLTNGWPLKALGFFVRAEPLKAHKSGFSADC